MATVSKIAEVLQLLRFKGHSMLAPFTAGWQTTDLHPLVIEKSEVNFFLQNFCFFFFNYCHVI